jgi:hypothetical protein
VPALLRETVFAAAGNNPNVNTGSIFENPQSRLALSMSIVATVAANFALINVGPQVVAEEHPPFVLANTYGIIPDHFYYTAIAEINQRIVIAVRATVAVTYRSVVLMGRA